MRQAQTFLLISWDWSRQINMQALLYLVMIIVVNISKQALKDLIGSSPQDRHLMSIYPGKIRRLLLFYWQPLPVLTVGDVISALLWLAVMVLMVVLTVVETCTPCAIAASEGLQAID